MNTNTSFAADYISNNCTYQWVTTGTGLQIVGSTSSPNVSIRFLNNTGGSVALTVNNPNCGSSTTTRQIVVSSSAPATPTSIIRSRIGLSCEYEVKCSAVTGALAYEWSFDNFVTIDSRTNSPVHPSTIPARSASKTYFVRAVNNCGFSGIRSSLVSFPAITGNCPKSSLIGLSTEEPTVEGENYDFLEENKVYPNPSDNVLFYKSASSEPEQIEIINLSELVAKSFLSTGELTEISTSELENGLYFLKSSSPNGTNAIKFQVLR